MCVVVGGMCGRGVHACPGGAWPGGACVAGETAIAADGTHSTGMHSCSLIRLYNYRPPTELRADTYKVSQSVHRGSPCDHYP